MEILSFIEYPELLTILQNANQKLLQSESMREAFEEYQIPFDQLLLIPVCFADLEVSARTEKGIIYLNFNLLEDYDLEDLENCTDAIDHYLSHEYQHWLQQTTGDGPTQGSGEDDYLDNPYEQEGFQHQTEYLTETRSSEEAEEYIDQVLDHHQVEDQEEREEKKNLLLSEAGLKEDLMKQFDQAIKEHVKIKFIRDNLYKLSTKEKLERQKKLQELLNRIQESSNE